MEVSNRGFSIRKQATAASWSKRPAGFFDILRRSPFLDGALYDSRLFAPSEPEKHGLRVAVAGAD